MPVLTLKFKDTKVKDFHLERGDNLTIGRLSSNNVVIENLAVSSHHAKIDSVDNGFLLTDLKSKNGTFVNGKLTTSHWLGHGDTINIGKHTLVFTFQEGEERTSGPARGMDQTMVMDTDKYKEMMAKSASTQAAQARKKAAVGVLSFLAGGEGEFLLNKKLTKIGKDSSCDIVVGGLMMGKVAATISMRPKGYYLSYVGGLTKPKVNDQVIKESVQLNEFDVIEIGGYKMQIVYRTKS
jgi:pSer/pThr/pTyr-binding forkhead associated (FHA) protein